MSIPLDIRTLTFIEVASAIILGIIMLLVWRTSTTYTGFGRWTLGKFFTALGFLLLSLRGQIPDLLSITLANVVITFATVLIFEGTRQFRNQRYLDMFNYALVGVVAITLPYFTVVQNSGNIRTAIVTTCGAIILLRCGALLVTHVPPELRASFWFTGATMIIYSGVLIFRAFTALTGPATDDLFAPDPTQAFFFTMTILAPMSWTFGTVIMTSDRLHELAITDFLTGIFNRRHFFELAQTELARSQREARPLTAVLFDLDQFKTINDTRGHSVGDLAIQAVVKACQAVLRPYDVLARYGGEEFVVLLPATDVENGLAIADRLLHAIAELKIPNGADPVNITASVGVAMAERDDADIDVVMRRADEALYRAKQAGRNCVRS